MKSVKELGERRVIEILLGRLEPMPRMPVPFGDDVSAVEIGDGKLAVVKTDMLVGKTDVPSQMSLWHAARKAVVMNVSDLAAKGVKPIALLAAIGLPPDLKKRDVEQIGEGLNAGAREYGGYVLGGDTSEASDLVVSCAAFGIGEKDRLLLRGGARPGDVVAVTGSFGNAAAGLRVLVQSLPTSSRLRDALVESVLMPRARLEEGLALSQSMDATAAIDSSDGLAWSLHELSRASDVGFLIDELPIAREAEEFARTNKVDPVELALYGGEEYEIIATIKPELWSKVSRKIRLIRIGEVTKGKTLVLKRGTKELPIEARGWEHFKSSSQNS